MKMSTLRSQSHLQKCPAKYLANSSSHPTTLSSLPSEVTAITNTIPPTLSYARKIKYGRGRKSLVIQHHEQHILQLQKLSKYSSSNSRSRFVIMGVVSVGVVMLLMGMDEQKAMALGPEGPLMEEFWDNVRRYGLYALTVSTGALWAIFQPIYELLKNPISAVFILVILGSGIFIVSQVVSAMVGISDFTYDYGY